MAGSEPLRKVAALLPVLCLLALARPGVAQDAAVGPTGPTPTPLADTPVAPGEPLASDEQLQAKRAEIEAQTVQARALAEQWSAQAEEYERARLEAPERLREIEADIEQLEKGKAIEIPAEATVDELEALLLGEEQELAFARKKGAELEEESARRLDRRKKIPELLADARIRLQELQDEAPAGGEAPLAEARQQLFLARRAAIEREIQAYEQELRSYDARGQLLVRRRDRASLRVAARQASSDQLRTAVTERRQREAERQAEEALESLEATWDLVPELQSVVRQLAEENAALARQRTGEEGLVEKIDEVRGKLARAEEAVAALESDFAQLTRKVEAVGLTGSVGLLLRRQRAEAPDAGKYRRFIRMRQELIGSVQLRQLELEEQRQELSDIERRVEEELGRIDAGLSPAERDRVAELLRGLLETKRRYVDALIADYETYFQKLVDFDAKQQQLIERADRLLDYVDQRILWIPSGEAVRPGLVADGRDALEWLLAPRFWGQLGRAAIDVLRGTPLLNLVVLVLVGASLPLARRLRPRIRALGEVARDSSCTRYAATGEALLPSLLLVPWLPGLVAYLGWRLDVSPAATQFTRCIASGMLHAAVVWITLQLPRQLLRPGGLAEAHFAWPAAAVRSLRRHLSWLVLIAVPATLLIFVFELRGEEAWKESVGRLAFLGAMLAAAFFAHRVLGEHGPIASIARPAGPAWRRPATWRVARAVMVAIPVLLALAAVRGYYWTALQLAVRSHWTVFFLFVLLMALQMSRRWSFLARRRGASEQAQQRREALAAQRAQAASGEAEAPEVPEPEIDLGTLDVQASRLLKNTTLFAMVLGLWVIWADVLPAVGMLREVELWNTTGTVHVEVTDAQGQRQVSSREQVVPVTLVDLLLSLLIASMTLALVRNLPGLLELSWLRRFPIGAGERYAYLTIAKYGITIAGLAFAFQAVGIGWSSIQWLVAAVGLGLGFGLQEIFANFISGLIILFERPIRVGDTVTVGDVSGTVTKIRIRATWITAFDRKELIVPNKEFVTGRLVNWSLSDPIVRVTVPVGIAYGSDVQRAMHVLERVASENPHVLAEPAPQVLFMGFGDSSLNFELRAYSPDVAHLLPMRHDLHVAIDRAFREAGIEISFPQRDLHLRSVPDAWRMPGASPEPEPER
jgi:potassium efflux system protein